MPKGKMSIVKMLNVTVSKDKMPPGKKLNRVKALALWQKPL